MTRTRAIAAVLLCGGCTVAATTTTDGSVYVDDGGAPPVACVERGQGPDIWKPVAATLSLPGDLGRILACQHVASHSAAEVTATAQYQKHGWTAAAGYEHYIIQYVSQGPAGQARRATALIYAPTGGTAPYPMVAVNHGTNGLGPSCGPTHQTNVVDYMALPLVGHGYAVVATDYFGMGVDEGVFSYGVGEAEGQAILDGVRALRSFDDGARFARSSLDTNALFLLGHSQGGQATLFAHQRYNPSLGAKLLGSITLAPGLGDIRGLNATLGPAGHAMDATMVFVTMVLYSSMTYYGAPDPSSWLTPAGVASLPPLLRSQCWTDLYKNLPAKFPTEGDLFNATFLYNAGNCPFYDSVACIGFDPWEGYLRGDLPGNFASDIPALILQGDKDNVVPPYTTACVAKRMKSAGSTAVTTCGYAGSDHYTLVDDSANDFLAWMAARRRGEAGSCPAPIAATCP